jgi:hypothetical protein
MFLFKPFHFYEQYTFRISSLTLTKMLEPRWLQFSSEEEARNTRHALHGVRWPISNPKHLNVDFASHDTLEKFRNQANVETFPSKPEPQRVERVVSLTTNGAIAAGTCLFPKLGAKLCIIQNC